MDLKVRKAGEKEFTKTTQKYGVEVFVDPNTGKLAYISETGSLAVLSGSATGGEKAKERRSGRATVWNCASARPAKPSSRTRPRLMASKSIVMKTPAT